MIAKAAGLCSPFKTISLFYRTVRQELSILVPVNHSHILRLIGVALSPRCLLIEFAPKGSLDVVLSDYKKAGRKLDPYSMQVCSIQVSLTFFLIFILKGLGHIM